MERLTGKTYKSLLESYISIYDNSVSDTQELQEQENIQEFLEVINELVEEGYDLSDYTYDELYEYYLEEGLGSVIKAAAIKAAQKYGPRVLGTLRRGAKEVGKIPLQGTKNIAKGLIKPLQSKVGSTLATIAGAEALLAGEKSLTRKALGKAGEGIAALGNAVYGNGQAPTARTEPEKPKPAPEKPKSLRILGGQVVGYDHFDPFETIKGHLIGEGYADTEEAALAIMANMSEDWRQSIIEGGFPGTPATPRPGDAGASGLKLIRTPGGQTGYTNKYSSGEALPSGTVNKIMSGQLMVKSKNNNKNIA